MPMHRMRQTLRCLGFCAALIWCVPALAARVYQESPMLREQVERGELPPVEERLPEEPAVVEPVNEIGVYGGTWRRLTLGPGDLLLDTRLGYDPLVRWDRTGRAIEPGLAKSWDVLDGGRTFVFHLREGLKWSDGHPMTSADFEFNFNHVLGHPEIEPVYPDWLVVGGERVQFSAPGPYTLVFIFARPYGIFPEMMAYRGTHIVRPKHYMTQFHGDFADPEELERRVRERGFEHWRQLYGNMASLNLNKDLPTYRAFQLANDPTSMRVLARRNPYYWKVDPKGNQLPYIDEIAYTDVANNEALTMRAMSGGVDFQARRIDASAYPVFMENRRQYGYRVLRDLAPDTICLYVNQHSKDDELRSILQNRDFRIGLSLAIDREEIIFILYSGMAVPARGVVSPFDPFYLSEFDEKYLEYDPERANALLDGILPRGPGGIRRLPSGRPFRQILHVYPSEAGTTTELWQLAAEYFRDVGLDFVVQQDSVTLSVMHVTNGNSDFWGYQQPGMHFIVDPKWYVPLVSTSYFAPLYGRYVATGGRAGVRPSQEFQQLVDWYEALTLVIDDKENQQRYAHKILRRWAEQSYIIGICRQELLTIVSDRFKNVPDTIIHDWRIYTPGYIGIEQFYIDPAAGLR